MLSKYRVLDLTDQRGHLAGLILRQLGAEVIAIEPPTGSPARSIGPFAGDVVDIERSLHHWAYNRGKKSIVIDRGTPAGQAQLRSLIEGADVLLDTCAPAERAGSGIDPEELQRLNPALVHVSITPFGGSGPKADWEATDLTVQAACGNMAITGDNDRPPVRAGSLDQAFHSAASEGAAAALIALFERQRCSGLGQHIDMSAQQSMNMASQSMMMAAPINAKPAIRISGGSKLQGIDIQQMWACKDGHASVTLLFGLMLAPFTQNLMDWVHEEGFCDEATRTKNWVDYATMLIDGREPVSEYERVKDCLTMFFATKTKAELLDAAMNRRVLIAPVWTSADVIDSDQLAARGYWESVDHDEVGLFTYPGAFAKFSETPLESPPSAPILGQHTEHLLAEPRRSPAIPISGQREPKAPALAGLKILDFTWVMAGPATSRMFADYGAEVIRIESVTKPDGSRTLQPFRDDVTDPDNAALWNNMNAGKRELSIDLTKPQALDIAWDLVDWADVIMESFSPGAMGAMGLDIDAIRARKPELVIASSSLMGQTGPLAKLAGFGTMAGAISGFVHPTGWPDRAPCGLKAYTDYTSPRWLAASILAAMEHRRVTGRGQYIDFSQAEAAMHLLGPALLEQTVDGRTWERIGNRDLVHVPHGAFPTIGDDKWIAIACTSDDLWQVLAREIGAPHLSELTREERHQREGELEELVAVWTSQHDANALMESLQDLGIPAHTVQNSSECAEDPQLMHRNHFVAVAHSTQPGGSTVIEGSRFVMSRTPATVSTGGPTFGEHTYEILSEVLGYDSEHIADLAAAEVLQ